MRFFNACITGLALVGLATSATADDHTETCPPYESFGEGPDLVLMPGLGSAPAVWDSVSERLSANYTVHLVHVAGFAGRAANGDPDTILDRNAQEIITYMDCNGIESAAYAGHSMGGFTGLILASEHPDRINNLVIVDSLPFFPLIFSEAMTVASARPQADRIRAQMLTQGDGEFAASQRTGMRTLIQNTAFHDQAVQWSTTSDRATFAGAIHALMTTDIRDQLSEIATPTTVIAASNAFVPRSRVEALYSNAYANLPDVEIAIVEDSFHFIMFDQPEAFGEALEAALAQE